MLERDTVLEGAGGMQDRDPAPLGLLRQVNGLSVGPHSPVMSCILS